ncbi:hypothetical protein GF407_00345 [candidate division KSB1 bacterium]|nr:hypothetical protein [candidate division KSB1 bacterium]
MPANRYVNNSHQMRSTMTCHPYKKWLYLYRSGELNEQEKFRLAKHLQVCAGCRKEAEKTRQLDAFRTELKNRSIDIPENMSINIGRATGRVSAARQTEHSPPWYSRAKLQVALLTISVILISAYAAERLEFHYRLLALESRMDEQAPELARNHFDLSAKEDYEKWLPLLRKSYPNASGGRTLAAIRHELNDKRLDQIPESRLRNPARLLDFLITGIKRDGKISPAQLDKLLRQL